MHLSEFESKGCGIFIDHNQRVKGSEVFVGGLLRSTNEEHLQEDCNQCVRIHMMSFFVVLQHVFSIWS